MRLSKKKLAVVLIALVPLTGCGSLQPGVAATVGDHEISMSDVDAFARGLCAYSVQTQGFGAPATQVRTLAASLKIQTALADQQAQGSGFVPDQVLIGSTLSSFEDLLTGHVPQGELEQFLETVGAWAEGDQFVQAVAQQQLGGLGGEVTDETVSEVAMQLYADWADEAGVDVDPRLGVWTQVQVVSDNGTLSVPVVETDPSARPCA